MQPLIDRVGLAKVEKTIRAGIPVALQCGQELIGLSKAEAKPKFKACMKQHFDEYMQDAPDDEKEAYLETDMCLDEMFKDKSGN